MACHKFEEMMRGKTASFQIDNTTAVGYLLREGRTYCKILNGLARKILLKCHKNEVMVCPEYLRGVENLWADALSWGKKAKKWSFGDPAKPNLPKWLGKLDLFASSWHATYPNISASISQTGEHAAEMSWKKGDQRASGMLYIIQLVLSRLVRWRWDLIMIIPFWPGQS